MLQQAELGGKEEHFSVIPFSYAGLQFSETQIYNTAVLMTRRTYHGRETSAFSGNA